MLLLLPMLAAPLWAATVELYSPASAAKTVLSALVEGDAAALRDSIYAETPEQVELAAAMADLLIATRKLGDVAKQAFGASGQEIGRGMLDPSHLAQIEQAKVTITGETARVVLPGQRQPMVFRKRGSAWRMLLNFPSEGPQQTARQTRLVRLMATATDSSAGEIASGTFKTPEAAVAAIQQRLHGVMLSFQGPSTTSTSTAPASQPADEQQGAADR